MENTPYWSSNTEIPLDHLHIRGEYSIHLLIKMILKGSPPHTWRIPIYVVVYKSKERITSTYVENTLMQTTFDFTVGDHLHIRGEYKSWVLTLPSWIGSPPHTWRIHILDHPSISSAGITSTYVENTGTHCLDRLADRDHLHIRGEYIFWLKNRRPDKGSPPHTWRIRKSSERI